MAVRSMTGFAQVTGQASDQLGFTLSLKSVNHRFLDLHFRVPPDNDALEMKLRRVLKEKMARGHVEFTLAVERVPGQGVAFNRELVRDYVNAFRAATREFGISAEPDLNTIFKMPGALEASGAASEEGFDAAVMTRLDEALARLNDMRAEEGRGIERELRERMARLQADNAEVIKHRTGVLRGYVEKLRARMQELIGNQGDPDRVLQEAALLADRSDIQEEVVRMDTHIKHFLGLLESKGEIGKKLDFLLQEMNREANTLLSKTSGVTGEALRITELGLRMKAEIEKAREQAQNIE
jgi:uncharacterized protein (TIGR00255 family)